jgi:hypothetical protein
MSLPSSRYTGASSTNTTLGGGALTYTATAGEFLGARASPNVFPTDVERCPSHLPIASFPWSVSTTVSWQNEFPLSPRSCRIKPHQVSCIVARDWARPSHRPWRLSLVCSAEPSRGGRDAPEPLDLGWTTRIRMKITLQFN